MRIQVFFVRSKDGKETYQGRYLWKAVRDYFAAQEFSPFRPEANSQSPAASQAFETVLATLKNFNSDYKVVENLDEGLDKIEAAQAKVDGIKAEIDRVQAVLESPNIDPLREAQRNADRARYTQTADEIAAEDDVKASKHEIEVIEQALDLLNADAMAEILAERDRDLTERLRLAKRREDVQYAFAGKARKALAETTDFWLAYAKRFDALRFGTSTATDIDTVADDISNGKVATATEDGSIVLDSDQGSATIDDADTDQPYMTTTGANGDGSLFYAIAHAWAYNNHKTIVVKSSLSDINAHLRRTSNMLSAALRAGDTRHMEPGSRQGIEFNGDAHKNIGIMLKKEMDVVLGDIPALKKVRFNLRSGEFTLRNGTVLNDAELENLVGGYKNEWGIGETTAKRAIITNTLIKHFTKYGTLSATESVLPERLLYQGNTSIEPIALSLKGWSGSASDLSRLARDVYTKELQGTRIYNASIGGEVAFTAEGKGEAFGARGKLRKPIRAEMVHALREIVGNAMQVAVERPQKGREKDTSAFRTLLAPLLVYGQMHAVRVTVRDAKAVPSGDTPHKFYDITSLEIKRSPSVHGVNPESEYRPAPAGASGVTVAELAQAFNIEIGHPQGKGKASGPRGLFDPESFTIALLNGSDLSTTLHEGAHFFFENDMALASRLLQSKARWLAPGAI